MEEVFRPDPDALLAQISKQSEQSKRGKLKIFFGMCPGVGKTYAMLQAARQMKQEGVEVLVGFVETHGRKETQALLEGLPVADRSKIEYRGTLLEEMDLDPILTWHPQLVLVDELAHTNVPGSRHPKRYQDVLELLDAGINVYTTLNVQHVESRKDTVMQITGIEVRETVPDSILDMADEITLLDLTPAQLRSRLAEGKVYLGERALSAAENFFCESNLIALREMSLRLTAEHVDRDLRQIKPVGVTDPWKAGDRLLVAISPSPTSERLVRWTRRMAATMEASWLAVYVETPRVIPQEATTQLAKNIALARELGGEVIVNQSPEIGDTIVRIATQNNVSQIIVGKPGGRSLGTMFKQSLVDWLIRNSGDIDVHMVRATDSKPRVKPRLQDAPKLRIQEFGNILSTAAFVTLISLFAESVVGYRSIALFYLLGVIFAALKIGRVATLFLAGLSAALWDYVFIPPKFTFYVSEPHDFMMLAMFFVVAVIIGHLTTKLREKEVAERGGEARATSLYHLSQALASSTSEYETVGISVKQLYETFGCRSALLLCDENGIFLGKPHDLSTLQLGEKEVSVASWVYLQKQPAGRSTDTLPDSTALHIPLITRSGVVGVLAVEITKPLAFQQRALLETFTTQIALALEKDQLALQNSKAQVSAQSEQLQRTLFDSVSHEIKTPLAAISVALEQTKEVSPVLQEIRIAVDRLTRVVNHLLDMTRLDSGLLKPDPEWLEPEELITELLQEFNGQDKKHPITLNLSNASDPIFVDGRLLKQVLGILLNNAIGHGLTGGSVLLSYTNQGGLVLFSVADSGNGIKKGEEEKIFDKFYRIQGTPAGGIGLGLSIAKRLVESMGGKIVASNRPEGGAIFTISFQINQVMQIPTELKS